MKRGPLIGFTLVGALVGIGIGVGLRRQRPVPAAGTAAAVPATSPGGGSYQHLADVVMATRIEVLLPARQAAAGAEVFRVFREVDARMSEWKDSSPLSAVNRAAGRAAVPVPADLREVIRRGIRWGERSGGAFDVTWAALWGLWDFKAARPVVPPAAEIERRRVLVDYRDVEVDDARGTVRLRRAGMKIGLGAIAKGHAVDRAAAALRVRGVRSFLLSAGGQVLASGRRDGRPWRVGIRDPRGPFDDYFGVLQLVDESASTSGDYESFFIKDGMRYHHILDPRTGRPARGLRSATVIARDATTADALSTAAMVLGPRRAPRLAAEQPGLELVLVDEHGRVLRSPGLSSRFKLLHQPRAR